MRRRTWLALVPVAVGLLTVGMFSSRAAESKEIITFQCRLVHDGIAVNGTMTLTFEVWDLASGGTVGANRKHDEDQTLYVSNGLVSAQLGNDSLNPIVGVFSDNDDLWVAVKLGATDLLGGRVKLTAVPYSMNAARASALWDAAGQQSYAPSDFVLSNTSGGNTTVVGQAGTLILQASDTHVSSGTVILHGTIDVTNTLQVGEVIELANTSTPTTVTSGHVALYAKSNSLYYKPSGGSETEVGSGAGPGSDVVPSVNGGRIGVHSSDPLGEVASVGTIYLHRHTGDRIALYDGSDWAYYTLGVAPVTSLALSGGTASTTHDVFAYASGTTVTLEITAWTSNTSRSPALTLVMQDGVWSKTGALTRRYLGSIYLDASKQVTFDSTERGLWNQDNRREWQSEAHEDDTIWSYTTPTWRESNGATTNRVYLVIGRKEDLISAEALAVFINTTYLAAGPGIGIDSTTTNSAQIRGGFTRVGDYGCVGTANWSDRVAEGRRFVSWLERSDNTAGTTRWIGAGAATHRPGLLVRSWH